MTFYLVGGITCTIAAVLCVVIYLISHRANENSTAGKIIFWVGTLLGVAGASLLTIEFSFPSVSHPRIPTIVERFEKFYGDGYKTYIEDNVAQGPVDEFISATNEKLKTTKPEEGTEGYWHTMFRTEVIYRMSEDIYCASLLNDYSYSADYDYQSITTWRMENVRE